MAAVAIHKLTKVYSPHGIAAVQGLQLRVDDGEYLVLVGPSASGKTTTLRLIAGLEKPTSGRIEIADRDVTTVVPRQRNVSMAFQHPVLYGHLNVEDNLAFGMRLRSVPSPEVHRRAGEISKLLNLADLFQRRPDELSGGQRQRVALGRALIPQADCYLLDEPLGHLDDETRRNIRSCIQEIRRHLKMTIIHVTHDQFEAMALGDRIAVIRDGQLQQCATPSALHREPANRFVAGFTAQSPMSFIVGRLTKADGSLYFENGSIRMTVPQCHQQQLQRHSNNQAVLGFRADAVQQWPQDTGINDASFMATILSISPLGDQLELLLSTANTSNIVARVPRNPQLKMAAEQRFRMDPNKAFFFAADQQGANLLGTGENF